MRLLGLIALLAACTSDTPDDTGVDTDTGADTDTDTSDVVGTPNDVDGDGVTADTDCDDEDDTVYPGAIDLCDGVDNDCDGVIDGGLTVPGDHATIQAAIDAAPTGGVVCVAPGTYTERLTVNAGTVSLVGMGGSEETMLDGQGLGSVVNIDGASEVTLDGFTLTAGHADKGAGLLAQETTLFLFDVTIDGNTCDNMCEGVGMYLGQTTAVLEAVAITNNRASLTDQTEVSRASGIGLYSWVSDVTAVDLEVSDNQGDATPALGGFVEGGGIYISGNSDFDGDRLTVVGNLARNSATASNNHARGGGIAVWGDADIRHAVIADNVVEGNNARGGGVFVREEANVTLSNSQILGNRSGDPEHSEYGYGGGLFVDSDNSTTLSFLDIVGNTVDGSRSCGGGGLFRSTSSPVTSITSTIFATNELACASGLGGAISSGSRSESVLLVRHSLFWDNTQPAYSIWPEPDLTDGNFEADPMYASLDGNDPLAWDLHPTAGSAFVNAGDPELNDTDGSRADMGAYGGPDPL